MYTYRFGMLECIVASLSVARYFLTAIFLYTRATLEKWISYTRIIIIKRLLKRHVSVNNHRRFTKSQKHLLKLKRLLFVQSSMIIKLPQSNLILAIIGLIIHTPIRNAKPPSHPPIYLIHPSTHSAYPSPDISIKQSQVDSNHKLITTLLVYACWSNHQQ